MYIYIYIYTVFNLQVNLCIWLIFLQLNPFDLSVDREASRFEHSVS